jgi:glycosyltransferase involved in cell wall biosynthesis
MRPTKALRAHGRGVTIYVDATPLGDKFLSGIGRYTARLCLSLAARGARVRFFGRGRELLPPSQLDWSHDQDLAHWASRVWNGGRFVPLLAVPEGAIGLWTDKRPPERTFPIEVNVLHDLTPVITPSRHEPQARAQFEQFIAQSLLSSDAALAISHSAKADAAWLTDFPQNRIKVVHSGPGQCVLRHLHERPVARRSNVGLMVASLEPRENAGFVIDWLRSSALLPEGTELWWVNQNGWPKSFRMVRDLERGHKGRHIRLVGPASDRKLCELYHTVGWSVYPSLYEGLGFPVLDSLRHGVPVLTSCHSSLREFAHAGVHFFNPHDASTLDQAWAECLAARPNVVSSAQLDDLYNWERVARAIMDLAPSAHPVANELSYR